MKQDLKEKVQKQEDKWENVKMQNLKKDLEEERVAEDQEDVEDFQMKNK